MCYKGGPRCSAYAYKNLVTAVKRYKDTQSDGSEAGSFVEYEACRYWTLQYDMTPKGQQSLRSQIAKLGNLDSKGRVGNLARETLTARLAYGVDMRKFALAASHEDDRGDVEETSGHEKITPYLTQAEISNQNVRDSIATRKNSIKETVSDILKKEGSESRQQRVARELSDYDNLVGKAPRAPEDENDFNFDRTDYSSNGRRNASGLTARQDRARYFGAMSQNIPVINVESMSNKTVRNDSIRELASLARTMNVSGNDLSGPVLKVSQALSAFNQEKEKIQDRDSIAESRMEQKMVSYSRANSINSRGMAIQIDFLIGQLGTEGARKVILSQKR